MSALLEEAEALGAEGDVEGVLERWARTEAARLDDAERTRWALLLAQAGAIGDAETLAASVSGPDHRAILGRAGLTGESVAGEAEPGSTDVPDDADDALDVDFGREATSSDELVVEAMLRWFGGRRDLYARQWHDERRSRSGYHPVREPLDPDVMRAHLAGRVTLGQYLLFPDATVACAVIDLDLGASALAELRAQYGDDVSPLRHDGLRSHARRLMEAARSLGLPLFAEDSGGRGLHLWLFLAPRRAARAARALLAQIVAAAGPQPVDVGVEIFPKQDGPGARGLSSLVKLPLGIHRATSRPCPLLDDALAPIDSTATALERLRPADPAIVDAILGRRLVALPAPELEAPGSPPPLPAATSPRTLAEALRAIEGGIESRKAAERMLSGCAALAAIVRKAYDQRRLAPDEARALVYTLGLVGDRSDVAEDALRAANLGLKELERARRGLPSPTGCSRLRALVPSVRCSGCPSGADAVPYATPCLFAVGPRAPAEPRHAPFATWLDADETAVQGPLDALGAALGRIEERLARIEAERAREDD